MIVTPQRRPCSYKCRRKGGHKTTTIALIFQSAYAYVTYNNAKDEKCVNGLRFVGVFAFQIVIYDIVEEVPWQHLALIINVRMLILVRLSKKL